MPKYNQVITKPVRDALLACFEEITLLVQPEMRHRLILVGGAASVAHSSTYYKEDVDVAAPPYVLLAVWNTVRSGGHSFTLECDGRIAFDAPQGFLVRVDLIEIGGEYIDKIHTVQPFLNASLASKADLLRLRAAAVVERGDDGDIDDFQWLIEGLARDGKLLPILSWKETDDLLAAGKCIQQVYLLVLAAIMGTENERAALKLIGL